MWLASQTRRRPWVLSTGFDRLSRGRGLEPAVDLAREKKDPRPTVAMGKPVRITRGASRSRYISSEVRERRLAAAIYRVSPELRIGHPVVG